MIDDLLTSVRQSISSLREGDRGVSQIIGYAIVFSIVVMTVSGVLITAPTIFDNVESNQATITASQNFEQINTKIDKVEDGANQQFLRINLPAGQIGAGETTTITVNNTSGTATRVNTTPLIYQSPNDRNVILAGGIVASKHAEATTSYAQLEDVPLSAYTDTQYMFPVANLSYPRDSVGYSSTRSNTNTYLINRSNKQDFSPGADKIPVATTQVYGKDTTDTITVTINTSHPTLWENYLKQHPAFDTTDVSSTPADYTPSTRTTITATTTLNDEETFTITGKPINIISISQQ